MFGRLFGRRKKRKSKHVFEAFPLISGGRVDKNDPTELQGTWRRITGTLRDFDKNLYEKSIEIALFLWLTNPVARTIVRYLVDYTLGDGVKFESENKAALSVVEGFWNHPRNNMPAEQFSIVTELIVAGQVFLPVTLTSAGTVLLGYISPRAGISFETPDGERYPTRIVISKGGAEEKAFNIVTSPDTQNEPLMLAFFINRLPLMSHGVSELFHIADWLDMQDQALASAVEAYALQSAFVWDVTINGASDEECEEAAQAVGTPKPGTVRVHSDEVTWQAVSPALKSTDLHE
ncbi:MAG: hypothetical protein DRO87_13245, partial [Candidatus Thorarchaeota archaeon]